MPETDVDRMQEAITRLQQWNRRLALAFAFIAVLCVGLIVLPALRSTESVQAAAGDRSILRVRGLIITDDHGVERVWIGAPLPNPPLFGKRYKRSVSVSGILLFDADGNERSGYVTNDRSPGPVFLSLDSVGSEVADFTAHAGGGVTAEIRDGSSSVSLGAAQTGASIKLHDKGKLIFQQPAPATGPNP